MGCFNAAISSTCDQNGEHIRKTSHSSLASLSHGEVSLTSLSLRKPSFNVFSFGKASSALGIDL